MKDKTNTKGIYFDVPLAEYQRIRVFAVTQGVTIQRFLRDAAAHFIEETKKAEKLTRK